jgi:HK97 family phage portal protein
VLKIPLLSRLFGERSNETLTSKEFAQIFLPYGQSKAGVPVNHETAVRVSAVFACVNLISQTIAGLPLQLYRRTVKGKEKAIYHGLYSVLHDSPNKETTSFDFWQMFVINLLLCGDGFAVVKRDGDGTIRELWNIPSKNVTIYRNSQTLEKFYVVTDDLDGKQYKYYPENILHVPGLRYTHKDLSLDPISIARDALGLAVATEEYGSKYFSQGANPGGIVEYEGKMSDTAFDRFKSSFNEKYSGIGNSSKVLFLESGAKYQKIGNAPEESQFLETRKFQVIEVARFFNVPPHMIMDLERATFSNIEQQSINFVQYCLTPWLVKIEQAVSKDLLTQSEKAHYFTKFNVNGLLRGDISARKDFYQVMLQNGVYAPNDVLELEDSNGYEGGDIHMVNGNMVPVSMLEQFLAWKMKGGDKSGQKND